LTSTLKTRGRVARQLAARRELFIQLCAQLGNRTLAYRRAGYKSKHPNKDAYDLARLPHISARIQEAIDGQVGGKAGLTSRLAQIADADIKDFEPWLEGDMSLAELAEEGVDVGVVESVSIHAGEEGETRRLKLYSKPDVVWKLIRLGGYGEGGADPDAPKPAEVHVTIVNGRLLAGRMAELAALPSAPGLPRRAGQGRFAGQRAGPLMGKTTAEEKA
jgi:hypothetical protein